eukprot:3799-Heterococcus_DN1.PRE.4
MTTGHENNDKQPGASFLNSSVLCRATRKAAKQRMLLDYFSCSFAAVAGLLLGGPVLAVGLGLAGAGVAATQ